MEVSDKHSIRLDSVSPLVRFAQQLTITDPGTFGNAVAYDHRIFLCIGGKGQIIIAGDRYEIEPGTLLIWGPGLEYSYHPENGLFLELLGFNFDYTQESSEYQMPIPPAKPGGFNPESITEHVFFEDAKALNSPLLLNHQEELRELFFKIKNEFTQQRLYSGKRCGALFTDLIIQIVRTTEASGPRNQRKGKADEIITYIQNNFDKELTNQHLGAVFGYHPAYIGRIVAAATGLPPHQYLLNYRIARAIDLLQSGEANVSQICYQCGFRDLGNFSKCFKARTGRNPSEYLNK